jgi:hypothetical protein
MPALTVLAPPGGRPPTEPAAAAPHREPAVGQLRPAGLLGPATTRLLAPTPDGTTNRMETS